MAITIRISKLRFTGNQTISTPITVDIHYKLYYDTAFTLMEANVPVDVDGTILASPLPSFLMNPAERYVLRASNLLCGFEYFQDLFLNPYCPAGYELAPDNSFCFIEEIVAATPPISGEVTVEKNHVDYSACGSYIYAPGYNLNGTGPSVQISIANVFWANGGTCAAGNTTDGPLNRSGLWSTTQSNNQTIGFSVCIDIPVSQTYFIGMGSDNLGIIKLDGVEIIHQDPTALGVQYGVGAGATFKVWHIYPVVIAAGSHVLELIGFNVSGVAAMGMEIYNNTEAEIIAATDYVDLDLVFSTKDYIGQPVVLGSDNIGYSCPSGFSLRACASPFECVRLLTTPVLY